MALVNQEYRKQIVQMRYAKDLIHGGSIVEISEDVLWLKQWNTTVHRGKMLDPELGHPSRAEARPMTVENSETEVTMRAVLQFTVVGLSQQICHNKRVATHSEKYLCRS